MIKKLETIVLFRVQGPERVSVLRNDGESHREASGLWAYRGLYGDTYQQYGPRVPGTCMVTCTRKSPQMDIVITS